MKKTIVIVIAFLFGMMIFRSSEPSNIKTFWLTVPTGTDTTYYFEFWHTEPWGAEVHYHDFDAADAVLDFGACSYPDGSSFNRLDNASLPFTLADSTVAIEKSSYNFKYLALKLTSNSVTADLTFKFIIHSDTRVKMAGE